MNQVFIVFLILMINSAQAQVFKCEAKTGQIIYQDKVCNNSKKQKEISIQDFDTTRTFIAREKLSMELQQRKELEAIRQEHLLQERKINALNAQAISTQELAEATRENAYATKQNTEAADYRKSRSNFYYYNSPKHRHTKPFDKSSWHDDSKKPAVVRHDNKTVSHFNPPIHQPKRSSLRNKRYRQENKMHSD